MKRITCMKIIILTILTLSGLMAQTDWKDRQMSPGRRNRFGEEKIPYKTLFLITQNPDTMDFYLYVPIWNHQLQFVTQGDSIFEASYEMTLLIRNDADEIMANEIRRGKSFASSYARTKSTSRSETEIFHFNLAPGKYKLYLEIFDLETRRQLSMNEDLTIPNLSKKPLSLSSLMFVENDEKNIHPQTLTPIFDASRLQNDTLLAALFFAITDGSLQTLQLRQIITDAKQDTVRQDETPIPIHARIQPVLLHLKQHLAFGKYHLDVIVSAGQVRKQLEDSFYVKWGSHPAFMPDLDLAVQSLIYVADDSELKKIQQLSKNEQSKWLEDFWKSRDPDPETEYNGLEDEYYRRVTISNQRFSIPDGTMAGWQADRGRIYIMYGPPSDIDHPRMEYSNTTRYEIWYYRNLQKRFVFSDRFGTGDYRLISQE